MVSDDWSCKSRTVIKILFKSGLLHHKQFEITLTCWLFGRLSIKRADNRLQSVLQGVIAPLGGGDSAPDREKDWFKRKEKREKSEWSKDARPCFVKLRQALIYVRGKIFLPHLHVLFVLHLGVFFSWEPVWTNSSASRQDLAAAAVIYNPQCKFGWNFPPSFSPSKLPLKKKSGWKERHF